MRCITYLVMMLRFLKSFFYQKSYNSFTKTRQKSGLQNLFVLQLLEYHVMYPESWFRPSIQKTVLLSSEKIQKSEFVSVCRSHYYNGSDRIKRHILRGLETLVSDWIPSSRSLWSGKIESGLFFSNIYYYSRYGSMSVAILL